MILAFRGFPPSNVIGQFAQIIRFSSVFGDIPLAATQTTGNWDTSDPLYYDWWRRQARGKKDEEPPPELIAEIRELIAAPITRNTPISPQLIRALAGQAEIEPFDAAPITAAIRAAAIAELKRIAAEEQDEDEAIMLLMLN